VRLRVGAIGIHERHRTLCSFTREASPSRAPRGAWRLWSHAQATRLLRDRYAGSSEDRVLAKASRAGMRPVMCASGSATPRLNQAMQRTAGRSAARLKAELRIMKRKKFALASGRWSCVSLDRECAVRKNCHRRNGGRKNCLERSTECT
jgi:hypothetical protein